MIFQQFLNACLDLFADNTTLLLSHNNKKLESKFNMGIKKIKIG